MQQIFIPKTTFNQNVSFHTAYTPVLSLPGIMTNVGVSRVTSEIGYIAYKGNIAALGTQTLALIDGNHRFIIKELIVACDTATEWALLDGATPIAHGRCAINIPWRCTFGNVGYLSTALGNDIVMRNEGVVAEFSISLYGWKITDAGSITRF